MIYSFEGKNPNIKDNCFIAESADVIGDVIIEEDVNIWFGAVVRGDSDFISIGRGTNIQDNCILHCDEGYPVEIGQYVTVGHGVIIHGCKIEDHALIGMGATILDGVEIGENTIIGAGSIVTKGKKIPPGVLCLGSPAKVIRNLTEDEKKSIMESAQHYVNLSKKYNKASSEK